MRIRGFAPGTPCWVELASAAPGRTQDFYAALFGWEPAGDRFTLDGRAVAGLTRHRPGRPAGWLSYLSVPDITAAVERFTAAGGRCLADPAPGRGGRGAIVADPVGAVLGLWQPDDFAGAQAAGEPGTMAWPELLTDAAGPAAEFYGAAVGWLLRDEHGSHGDRGEWLNEAHDAVAGLVPGDRAARWRAAFQVADCAAAVDRALELGGTAVTRTTEYGLGSYAELRDPEGAAFAVTAPAAHPVELTLSFSPLAGLELTY